MDPLPSWDDRAYFTARALFSAAEVSRTHPEETSDPIWGSVGMASRRTVTCSLPAASQ